MEISAESGVGKLNNFACYVFWLMLECIVLSIAFSLGFLPISSSLSHIYNLTIGVKMNYSLCLV